MQGNYNMSNTATKLNVLYMQKETKRRQRNRHDILEKCLLYCYFEMDCYL